MKIRWLGHACFLITSAKGTRILTDPFDETVGYVVPAVEADFVTVSHEHFDHNAVGNVKGKPKVVRGAGAHSLGDVSARGIDTFHDGVMGAKRGPNTVFVLNVDGMSLCHLGDLGHVLEAAHLSAIGRVDVLLVPVGGTYTIDPAAAAKVVEQISPSIVIPMHYKTDATSFPIVGVDEFLQKVGGGRRIGGTTVEITKEDLTGTRKVYVLEYA
ncbi:MAG: MBL fold metallo-hydrolase [Candidatus Rokubacteria bacterium]|nr:MBL fold metallo-hydrolase [Candidatus Rokubacteria bacterium]